MVFFKAVCHANPGVKKKKYDKVHVFQDTYQTFLNKSPTNDL